MEDWLDKLETEMKKRERRPAPGFYTIAQIEKKLKLSHNSALALITRKLEAGTMEVEKFLVDCPNGRRMVNHYREKK